MSKKMFTPGSGGGNKPAQASIPDDILPFVQPPTHSVSKPVTYDPLSSIQAPKPTTRPRQPTIPLVVFTAFDVETAEKLSKRLQNTVHPADTPAKPATDRLSSIRLPETPSEPSPPDITPDIEEPEIIASDPEFAWSSEQPYLSMNIADLSYYISAQQDELVRSVTISLQHEKFILAYLENPVEYLKNFAEYGWDEESDEAAEEFIQWYVSLFRSELEEQRELRWSAGVESDIEYWIRDVTNDERESVIVYDLDAGETLFVRFGDKNSVTMQKIHQKLAAGRNIVVIHNHPNHTGASLADFSAVAWLDAEYLIVVNPDGRQHHHRRIGDTMVALEPIHNPDYVAPADPLETLAADLAYFFQSLLEVGNPPEMVMRQGETYWWQQEDLIIVPYDTSETGETIEEVAARIVGPPPGYEISGESYEQLQEEYSKKLTEFTAYLTELNPGYTGVGSLHIPLPGWSVRKVHSPRGSQARVSHVTRATLLDPPGTGVTDQARSIKRLWNSLSAAEQQIEMALMGSDANIDKFVTFANAGHDFDYTLAWLRTHENAINQAVSDFAVPSALLNTVLGSEILYDYGHDDSQQDATMRSGFRDAALRVGDLASGINPTLQESWDGTGIANAHYPALIDAYHFVKERLAPGETHPWDLDPNAPDLESAPKLEPSDGEKSAYVEYWADYYDHRSFNELSRREQEVVLFWIRDGKLNEVPWDMRQEIAYYAASVVGTVRMAAMISHMYGETLEDIDSTANVADNPRDMARVWGRYRSADQYFDYLGNAHLAYPVADYWSKR